MRVKILGSAAGGGFPQWNCNCGVCAISRTEPYRAKPRTQSSVAISDDDKRWFLLNASPDLRQQFAETREIFRERNSVRESCIEAVLLSNSDLDHALGLYLLREGDPLTVYATPPVKAALCEGLRLGETLDSYCGVSWVRPPAEMSTLNYSDGTPSGIEFFSINISADAPRYLKDGQGSQYACAYVISDSRTRRRLLYAPAVARVDSVLLRCMNECDLILFDGTFWRDDEMIRASAGVKTAREMGHIPISGDDGSLVLLKNSSAREKVYIHINNTNPMLIEDSREHEAVLRAGIEVGADGMEFTI